jgi:hypothetical protein
MKKHTTPIARQQISMEKQNNAKKVKRARQNENVPSGAVGTIDCKAILVIEIYAFTSSSDILWDTSM